MELAPLLQQYGYLLLFIGVFAEGETLLLLAGYFAHRGYLSVGGVLVTAYVAAVCGDQFFFHMGRRHAKGLLQRFPRLREKVNLAIERVERHQAKIVLAMRFLWGLRIALPVALGLTTMSARKYFFLDLLSASVWATTFTLLGYSAGEMLDPVIHRLHHYEMWVAVVLAAVGVVILTWRWVSARRCRRDPHS
jgi:membrane protein DedA with SNARE-associated domain